MQNKSRCCELSISDVSDDLLTPKRPCTSTTITSPSPQKGSELHALFEAFEKDNKTVLEPFISNFAAQDYSPKAIPACSIEELQVVTEGTILPGNLNLLKVFAAEWWDKLKQKCRALELDPFGDPIC